MSKVGMDSYSTQMGWGYIYTPPRPCCVTLFLYNSMSSLSFHVQNFTGFFESLELDGVFLASPPLSALQTILHLPYR